MLPCQLVAYLRGGRHAEGVEVAGEAGGHALAPPTRGCTCSHEAHILNALPEQLASVIYPSLILQQMPHSAWPISF